MKERGMNTKSEINFGQRNLAICCIILELYYTCIGYNINTNELTQNNRNILSHTNDNFLLFMIK